MDDVDKHHWNQLTDNNVFFQPYNKKTISIKIELLVKSYKPRKKNDFII